MRPKLNVAISLDVEEEGLFRGRYQCFDASVSNVKSLAKLAPLFERGVRPTFFCAYPVVKNPEACRILEGMRNYGEIGAHLHHWNTPPIVQNIPASGVLSAVPAFQLPLQCLDAKLEHLVRECNNFLGEPARSFRMGRWDLHSHVFPLLIQHGFNVDASVRPLHSYGDKNNGPDHFGAPSDPYWISVNGESLLEAPLTVTPLLSPLAHIPARFAWGRKVRHSLRHWGALAILPVEHPLWLMKLTTNLHVNSGGRTLSIAWHSSDLMPGGNPRLSDELAVRRFINKIMRYLDWLESNFSVSYVTMTELRARINALKVKAQGYVDWTWRAEVTDACA